MKITKKEFKKVKKEILKYFNPLKTKEGDRYQYKLNTIYGEYSFSFDDEDCDAICGRFEDIRKYNLTYKEEEIYGIGINTYSGKMNFYFNQVYWFMSVLDKLVTMDGEQ